MSLVIPSRACDGLTWLQPKIPAWLEHANKHPHSLVVEAAKIPRQLNAMKLFRNVTAELLLVLCEPGTGSRLCVMSTKSSRHAHGLPLAIQPRPSIELGLGADLLSSLISITLLRSLYYGSPSLHDRIAVA